MVILLFADKSSLLKPEFYLQVFHHFLSIILFLKYLGGCVER